MKDNLPLLVCEPEDDSAEVGRGGRGGAKRLASASHAALSVGLTHSGSSVNA